MGLWSRLGTNIANGWRSARAGFKSGMSNAFNKTKTGLRKGWAVTKDFTSKHADTIGMIAGAALNAAAPALDSLGASTIGVPVGTALNAGGKMIAKKFAKNDTGWGRFAKGFSRDNKKSKLPSQLSAQSKAVDESNGHIAAGYSLSSTGNYYNGKNRKKSWFMG